MVIVDCPGFDNAEYRSALTVADLFVTPIKPSSNFEAETLTDVTATVRKAQKMGNTKLRPFVLFTRVKHNRTSTATELAKELQSDDVWLKPLNTRIGELIVFEDCANIGAGVHDVERASSLSKAKAEIELLANRIDTPKCDISLLYPKNIVINPASAVPRGGASIPLCSPHNLG